MLVVPFVLLILTTSLKTQSELTCLIYWGNDSLHSLLSLGLRTNLNRATRQSPSLCRASKISTPHAAAHSSRIIGQWRSRRLSVCCAKYERVRVKVCTTLLNSAAAEWRKPWQLTLPLPVKCVSLWSTAKYLFLWLFCFKNIYLC